MKKLIIGFISLAAISTAFAQGNGRRVSPDTFCGQSGEGVTKALMCHITRVEQGGVQNDRVDYQCMPVTSHCATRDSVTGWCLSDGNSSDVHYPVSVLANGDLNLDSCNGQGGPVTGGGCTGANCTTTLAHDASATIDISMGGYMDGIYVCGARIVGHACNENDTAADADYIIVNGYPAGPEWSILPTDIPVLTNSGTTDQKEVQIHLNSFRFGTTFEVKYCFDFVRKISGSITNSTQKGTIYDGNLKATFMPKEDETKDYLRVADISGAFKYECFQNLSDSTGGTTKSIIKMDDDTFGSFINDSEPSLAFSDIEFNLGENNHGGCEFWVTFSEGNVGTIRPLTESGQIYTGQITTNVSLDFVLENK